MRRPKSSMISQQELRQGRIVVVNADDFGASHQINQAILQAFELRLISSATMMANMPAFEEACELVHQHHLQYRVGVHLNITSGRPLTAAIADCPRFCDGNGHWRPRRRVLTITRDEALALEAEIDAQISACERKAITPTHLDSHHHMHTEWGIAPVVIRAAKRHGIRAIRLAFNCGPRREQASAMHRLLARAYRSMHNARLRYHELAKTDYFGDAADAGRVLQMTTADVEIMVHPCLDQGGRLLDLDGKDLERQIVALCIPPVAIRSYHGL